VDELNAQDAAGTCLWLKSCAQLATKRVCSDPSRHDSTCCLVRVYMMFSHAVFRCCLVKTVVVTPTVLKMVIMNHNSKISDDSNNCNNNNNHNNNNNNNKHNKNNNNNSSNTNTNDDNDDNNSNKDNYNKSQSQLF